MIHQYERPMSIFQQTQIAFKGTIKRVFTSINKLSEMQSLSMAFK